MKRLTLSFDKKAEKYPWVLKHPKVKENLAKFKTRQDAIVWFLSLDFESYIWFQNNQGIFGGQLASIINESGEKYDMMYIPKVSGFDGGEVYQDICAEFMINPVLMTRHFYKDKIQEILDNLDFELISDPNTYFPADLEMAKKKSSAYYDLKAIKANLEQKISDLQSKNNVAEETISNLKSELENEKNNFELINQQIENLIMSGGIQEQSNDVELQQEAVEPAESIQEHTEDSAKMQNEPNNFNENMAADQNPNSTSNFNHYQTNNYNQYGFPNDYSNQFKSQTNQTETMGYVPTQYINPDKTQTYLPTMYNPNLPASYDEKSIIPYNEYVMYGYNDYAKKEQRKEKIIFWVTIGCLISIMVLCLILIGIFANQMTYIF